MTYQTILFDIDNTLINSADLIAETLQKGAAATGVNVPVSEYRKRIGRPGDEILKEFGVTNWKQILADYMVEFERNMDQLTYFPGIEVLLSNLNELGIQTGVVTSKDQVQFARETKYFPLIAAAKIVTTSDLTTKSKPSAEPLLYTVKMHQLDLEQTLSEIVFMICRRLKQRGWTLQALIGVHCQISNLIMLSISWHDQMFY